MQESQAQLVPVTKCITTEPFRDYRFGSRRTGWTGQSGATAYIVAVLTLSQNLHRMPLKYVHMGIVSALSARELRCPYRSLVPRDVGTGGGE